MRKKGIKIAVRIKEKGCDEAHRNPKRDPSQAEMKATFQVSILTDRPLWGFAFEYGWEGGLQGARADLPCLRCAVSS